MTAIIYAGFNEAEAHRLGEPRAARAEEGTAIMLQ